MKRRSPFTLLEVLISLVLLGAILFTTFSMMRTTMISKREFGLIRQKTHLHHLIHQRLAALFIWTEACKMASYKEYPALFFDSKESLIEKNSPEKVYSHAFFVDKNNRLKLISLDQENVLSKQTLLHHVVALKVQFYDPENNIWLSKWESKTLPLMIKLTIEQLNDSPLIYTFFFPEVYEEQELQ